MEQKVSESSHCALKEAGPVAKEESGRRLGVTEGTHKKPGNHKEAENSQQKALMHSVLNSQADNVWTLIRARGGWCAHRCKMLE